MKRRGFLQLAGGAGVLAAGAASVEETLAAAVDDGEEFEGKVWLSEEAASYDGVFERVREYLTRAFGESFQTVTIERGPTVSVPTEDAARLMRGLTWPRLLLTGAAGDRGHDPASDLNLLVTDGDTSTTPAGIGSNHLAAVGGASRLARVEPPGDTVVEYTDARRVMQVVIHEAGHAVGLRHDHGSVHADGRYLVVSPMVSTYPWTPASVRERQFDHEHSACGQEYPDATGRLARLRMTFSECALGHLSSYSGGLPI